MGSHQLCLPLPSKYASDDHVEGYSFFCCGGEQSTPSAANHDRLEAYLDDLCAFMERTRLIQRHPEHFFDYIRGEAWREKAKHLDGSAISSEELASTTQLCRLFTPFFSDEVTSQELLRSLVRDGPPAAAAQASSAGQNGDSHAELREFYNATRSLMIGRQRRQDSDAACLTLGDSQQRLCSTNRAVDNATVVEEEARKQRVLDVVLGYGMSPKKIHEVTLMRANISNLVRCCNQAHDGTTTSGCCSPRVTTAINVGEGKGYVSRAIAMCDGFQVVGIDCNPEHKERAVGRVESLVEGSISLRDSVKGKDLVNLLYHPRGHVASVVCTLGEHAAWDTLLKGHVATIRDEHVTAAGTSPSAHVIPQDVGDALGASAHHQRTEKAQCRFCDKVVRLVSTAVVMKHANHHIRGASADKIGDNASRNAQVPPRAQFEAWNKEMTQKEYVQHLTRLFFKIIPDNNSGMKEECGGADLVVGTSSATSEPDTHMPEKRPRLQADDDVDDDDGRYQSVHLPRGVRVNVYAPTRILPAATGGDEKEEEASEDQWLFVETALTVLGFDEAAGRHRVILDDATRRESYFLYQYSSNSSSGGNSTGICQPPAPAAAAGWGKMKKALVIAVQPVQQALEYPVMVPSLANTVMIGLHPCGDLGSNVCRFFTQCNAQGLLLVSCCWHSLTDAGFPLSNALRRRGMTTLKISLLLATQPLDMWSTASAEGHRSSSKILFFRSTISMLWEEMRAGWTSSAQFPVSACEDISHNDGKGCPFAKQAYLEPAFLRKITRVKDTISFDGFVHEVLQEYYYADTAKQTAYTWHKDVCAACRASQEAYMRNVYAAGTVQAIGEQLKQQYFPAFLGLTVLRMWTCHLVETLLLVDRALYVHEELAAASPPGVRTAVSLAPLFDGAVSPRMYGIFARRWSE